MSFLLNRNFGLANGVFFNILNELVTPPSTVVAGFSIRPLYACLASSVKPPFICLSERNGKGDSRKKGRQ